MRRLLEYGGYAAAVVLVAFGIGALVLSINGKNTVQNDLSQEKIVGSADMTPDAIAAEAQKAGLSGVDFPELLGRGRADRHRQRGSLLRQLHANPRARGKRR